MKTYVCAVTVSVLAIFALRGSDAAAAPGAWPEWRGPTATGAAPDADPPAAWAEDTNIRWKTPIPGRGHSSPIVWNDRIFLTTAVPTDRAADAGTVKAVEAATPRFHRNRARLPKHAVRFVVTALKRSDGSVLWEQTACEQVPHAATHADGSWASSSTVTDGEHVYAYFGSYGLYAFDMDGNRKWDRQVGRLELRANFGGGPSPVLCGDTLVLNQDQEGPSFILALDKKTGRERWRADRDERTSWSTPLVVEHNGRRQVITSATQRMRGYDPASGAVLWEAGGMTGNVIPCPVAHKGVVFCMSGFRGSALVAIRLDRAKGDITGDPEAIAWSLGENTPYVPSPLLYDGLLYYLKLNKGFLTCVDAATGSVHYGNRKLEGVGTVYASPVGAGGRVYVTGRDGLTLVLRHGPEFEILGRNKLDDRFSASAALVDGELYLRGHEHLYCIR